MVYDFSRSLKATLKIKEDRRFSTSIQFSRTDGGAPGFTGDEIIMDIYDRRGGTLQESLTVGDGITITNATTLAFSNTNGALTNRSYYYELYNNTDGDGIMHSKLVVT